MPRKLLKLTNRSHRFALAAAEQALRDAGIRPTPDDRDALGLRGRRRHDDELISTSSPRRTRTARRRASSTRGSCSPIRPRTIRSCSAAARRPRGWRSSRAASASEGYATSVHTACASGGQALGTALKLIRRGSADCALAGGFDSMVSPIGIVGLLPAVRAVDRQRHAGAREPPVRRHAQRLRAGRRRGLPRARGMGGGAPRAARASTPSSPATAIRCRSYRITDSPPDGDGPIQAMRAALADAGATPGGRRLHQRARHVDGDERPQRDARPCDACSAPASTACPSARPRARWAT